jgi:hypothetical protein
MSNNMDNTTHHHPEENMCEMHYDSEGNIKLHVRSDGVHEYYNKGRTSLIEFPSGEEVHYNDDGSVHAVILADGTRQFFENGKMKTLITRDGVTIRYTHRGDIESIEYGCGHKITVFKKSTYFVPAQ